MSGKSVYIVETKYVLKISSFFPKKKVLFDKLFELFIFDPRPCEWMNACFTVDLNLNECLILCTHHYT